MKHGVISLGIIFFCFKCHFLHVAVNRCINCSSVHFCDMLAIMCLEANEDVLLDTPQTEEHNDVALEKDEDEVPFGSLDEPVDNNSHLSSSYEPPKLSVSESAVSAPMQKSQSVPQVSPAAKSRSDTKVNKVSFKLCCHFVTISS